MREGELQGSRIALDGSLIHITIVFGTEERLEERYDRFRTFEMGILYCVFKHQGCSGQSGSHRDVDISVVT